MRVNLKDEVLAQLEADRDGEQKKRCMATVFLAVCFVMLLWSTLNRSHFMVFAGWFWYRVVVAGTSYLWNSLAVHYFGPSALYAYLTSCTLWLNYVNSIFTGYIGIGVVPSFLLDPTSWSSSALLSPSKLLSMFSVSYVTGLYWQQFYRISL